MKRILTILIAALGFSFSACDKDDDVKPTNPNMISKEEFSTKLVNRWWVLDKDRSNDRIGLQDTVKFVPATETEGSVYYLTDSRPTYSYTVPSSNYATLMYHGELEVWIIKLTETELVIDTDINKDTGTDIKYYNR